MQMNDMMITIDMQTFEEMTDRIEELEAKLAKMLEIVRRHDTGDMRREDMEARRILEKLEDVMKGGE